MLHERERESVCVCVRARARVCVCVSERSERSDHQNRLQASKIAEWGEQ